VLDGLDDFRHGHHSEMTEEGMFLFGVVLGILPHAVIKVVIGILKMICIGHGA
jgi:hypothetical protein